MIIMYLTDYSSPLFNKHNCGKKMNEWIWQSFSQKLGPRREICHKKSLKLPQGKVENDDSVKEAPAFCRSFLGGLYT